MSRTMNALTPDMPRLSWTLPCFGHRQDQSVVGAVLLPGHVQHGVSVIGDVLSCCIFIPNLSSTSVIFELRWNGQMFSFLRRLESCLSSQVGDLPQADDCLKLDKLYHFSRQLSVQMKFVLQSHSFPTDVKTDSYSFGGYASPLWYLLWTSLVASFFLERSSCLRMLSEHNDYNGADQSVVGAVLYLDMFNMECP
ncbi:uncharacterized protein LOC115751595 [Rhodamnia argentea]|uniref:Uncharacterized protein LOC115751595 n=1 Tax=Rhodamnia argentea TaxID=178133 RepID=A0ABM3H3W8_9MYRT|nr:uncharacterized protein LOC115751595 [Rhodamnia argentea]